MADIDDDVEQRAVFIDTNLDTHLVLLVSPSDTFSILKQKMLVEHPKCFPDLGEIKISAVKVKRRGCYYHLLDSMLVRTAFYGIPKNWFLLADVSSQTAACCPAPSNVIAIEPSKALPALVASSNLFESGIDRNDDDRFGNHPSDADKILALEFPNKVDPSGVHIGSKSVEEAQNAGDSSEFKPMEEIFDEGGLQNNSDKKNKKKRKREQEGEHDCVGDENGERLDEGLHIDTLGNDSKLASDAADEEVPPPTPPKKKHKTAKKDVQETSPSKSKPVVRDSDRVSLGDDNGKNLDEGLPMDTVGSDLKLASDVADEEAPPPTPAKKKHKTAKKDAQETSPSKTMSVVHDSDRVNPESEAVVSKTDQGGVNELPSPGTSKDKNKKRKKEKRHPKSEFPAPEVDKKDELPSSEVGNKEEGHPYNASVESSALLLEDGGNNVVKDVQDGADHSAEGICTGLDKIVNGEVEITKSDLVPKSPAKKSKKSKKGDVDRVDKSKSPSEIPDESVVEFEAKPKKKKSKKAKTSTRENMDLSSVENKEPAPSVVSNGGVENGNYDVPDETDRGDTTQKTDKKRETKVKTSSVSYGGGTQEESDTGKISVNTKSKGEKSKRKNQKKQIVSIGDTHEVSMKEQSDEKVTQTDVSEKTDAVLSANREIDDGSKDQMEPAGDCHEDSSKTPMEVSTDIPEVKKTRASKRKAKKHDDATKLKDDNVESTEPVHPPPPIYTDEENTEITGDKQKKRTEKRQTKAEDPPESPMKEQFDERTKEMGAPNSAGVDLLASVAVSDANHQQEALLGDDHTENLDEIPPLGSASLAEVRNQEKPHSTSKEEIVKNPDDPSSMDISSSQTGLSKSKKSKESKRTPQNEIPNNDIPPSDSPSLAEVSKEAVKKLDLPSSIDTSLDQTGLNKSKKSKESKKTSQNGTKLDEPTIENGQLEIPLTQPSEKLVEPQPLSPPGRKTRQSKKAKELQKKPNESKNRGKVANASAKKKSLLVTRGAIFEDGSSESSDGGDEMEEGSGSSTKTPSDNMSSDYSEGESNGYVVSSRHDASKDGEHDGAKLKFSSLRDLPLHSVLRSSSRYRKAKVVAASQSQLEDSEAVEFVPDSQANL